MSRTKILVLCGLTLAVGFYACSSRRLSATQNDADAKVRDDALQMLEEGRHTFRHDTFGSEVFYGAKLRLHEALATVTPRMALELGLKVDSAMLPSPIARALQDNTANLDDPQVTASLLAANAVVGVTGFFAGGRLSSVGIHCALCHSTVDNSVRAGIGRRADGWANRDLDIGKIVSLSPNLQVLADVLQVPVDTVRTVLTSWGPGRFDAQLLLDGKGFRPDGKTAATLLPPAFGLAGVNQHTWTSGWGTVTYWNAFVANIEMQGEGTFFDPRLDDANKYPVAARARFGNLRNPQDRITAKLGALHFYQLALLPPEAPEGSFDAAAAERGRVLFAGKAGCVRCHVPPLFTEPGWNSHTADEIGIDDFQAQRSPDGRYRTAPLRGLHSHMKGGFYHDGRFPTLADVVEHYDNFLRLNLSAAERAEIVEYLKSL
jgi:hypothetical protein